MHGPDTFKSFAFLGSLFALMGVAAGAFGAHSLKAVLDPPMQAVFETAVRYQMYHALGLFLVAGHFRHHPTSLIRLAGWCFCTGIGLFSGSLYLMALTEVRWLGTLTPLGGLGFLAGRVFLGWSILRQGSSGEENPVRS